LETRKFFAFFETNVVGKSDPIMSQFTLIGLLDFHLRVHQFFKGDGDNFHSHPRHFISVCIWGGYDERLPDRPDRQVRPGTITVRRATDIHNVEPVAFPCLTIALTSPVVRQWEKFTFPKGE
jgi:hypothetical protein